MMAHTSSSCDIDPALWYGVTDPKARKRIQDRLAQRARRKRLSEAAKQTESYSAASTTSSTTNQKVTRKKPKTAERTSSCPKTTAGKSANAKQALVILPEYTPAPSNADESTETITTVNSDPESKALCKSTVRIPKSEYIYLRRCETLQSVAAQCPSSQNGLRDLPPNIDFIMAVEICGMVLGIAGCNLGFTRSPRQLRNVPEALQPSPLQLSTAHFLWIDKLPFPRLRDNLIILSDVIDIEEFLQDGLQMEAFDLDRGALPWDPRKWRVTPEFRAKWGYLFN